MPAAMDEGMTSKGVESAAAAEFGKNRLSATTGTYAEEMARQLDVKEVKSDLDVMDPSVFPGTGTPEYGGVTFMQLFEALKTVCYSCNIVGLDVNELCPPYDQTGASTAAACKIIRELLLSIK